MRKYEKILSRFREKNILVVGDIILDHYIWGKVDRISPEAPVPVVPVTRENFLLGGAGNVAHNIVSLGAKVAVSGIIGEDHRGRLVREILAERGIATEGVFVTPRPTTVKTRIIALSQQVVRVDREDSSTAEAATARNLSRYLRDALDDFDAIIIHRY